MRVCVCVCVCAHASVCICVYVCVGVCIYVYVCAHVWVIHTYVNALFLCTHALYAWTGVYTCVRACMLVFCADYEELAVKLSRERSVL